MKKTRWLSLFTAGVLALGLILSGCSSSEGQSSQESSSSQTEESSQVTETKVPTLYIGTYDAEGNGSFQEFPFVSSGEVTPENLIAAMGELTGWDLTLSEDDPVTTGKGGMTVSFAPESAIFTGPPEEQKDEFHMYSSDQLCYTSLTASRRPSGRTSRRRIPRRWTSTTAPTAAPRSSWTTWG